MTIRVFMLLLSTLLPTTLSYAECVGNIQSITQDTVGLIKVTTQYSIDGKSYDSISLVYDVTNVSDTRNIIKQDIQNQCNALILQSSDSLAKKIIIMQTEHKKQTDAAAQELQDLVGHDETRTAAYFEFKGSLIEVK